MTTSTKRSAGSKRAPLPRTSAYAKAFIKDWERLSRSGRYDMHRVVEVIMLLIANAGPLATEWQDHELQGEWAHHRECHIGGDLLLIYRADASAISFDRLGTHADLFE